MQILRCEIIVNSSMRMCVQQIFYYLEIVILMVLPLLLTIVQYGVACAWEVIQWGFPYFWKFIRYSCAKISMISQLHKYDYKIDEYLDQIVKAEIELKPRDVQKNNRILRDIVINRVVDFMKIKDDDFNDLYEDIMYGGSFYKGLKVKKPDEYDLCLMIDLSRSVNPNLIEVEPDKDHPTYVKVRLRDREFNENEKFWHKILNKCNHLNQNEFRDWIHDILIRALNGMSERFESEGYIVKHQQNTYTINYRMSGPAFTLRIIRKNDWRKIDVDLVPCLVFRNYTLPGFRPRKNKTWIAIAKPLKDNNIQNGELLWRTAFCNDEKRLLDKQIKPFIKLVKQLRDVQGWIHLKSYFIETLFLHELDDPIFRFCYPRFPKLGVLMYILHQLHRKLEAEELLDYWHEGFNLLNKNNSHSLENTAKELQEIIHRIDDKIEEDNEILLKIFDKKYDTIESRNYITFNFIFFCVIGILAIHEKFFMSVSNNSDKYS